jgi:hypothetical protein
MVRALLRSSADRGFGAAVPLAVCYRPIDMSKKPAIYSSSKSVRHDYRSGAAELHNIDHSHLHRKGGPMRYRGKCKIMACPSWLQMDI